MSDLRTLAAEAERIHTEYRRHFAGRSRYTRELGKLDELIAATDKAIAGAGGVSGADTELLPTLQQRAEMYRGERKAIAQLQSGGPDEALAHRTGAWSRLSRQRYMRNFAGQRRSTRDIGLLQALADDQAFWRDELQTAARRHDGDWHADDLAMMRHNADLYLGEVDQIHQARTELADNLRAQALATEANHQFRSWRLHFQDKPRRTRRAALLKRMVGSLERIHGDMLALRDKGFSESFHTGNIDNVARRIPLWKEELQRINEARAILTPDQLAGGLGEEANGWFTRYRDELAGKNRRTVSLEALAEICEGLFEVARAMEDQHRTWQSELNEKNLLVTLDNLKTYEREFELVRETQQPKA
ncbi:MAG: hypothetical protein H6742_16125 [Alphaproteobacteria bacterium]|nr:hypothetical protein [Alphaproteobacteria bacterium]